MQCYRITIAGYIDFDSLNPLRTQEELQEMLFDMYTSINEIEGLELAIRPLTAEEYAKKIARHEERMRTIRAQAEHEKEQLLEDFLAAQHNRGKLHP